MSANVMAIDGSTRQLDDGVLDALRARLRGPALVPPETAAETRSAWNAMYAGRPGLTTVCRGTADVVDAVTFARDNGLLAAVRGGGHSVAGLSSIDDGVLIDLSAMNAVQVDPVRRLAHVQGGAVLADVDRETQAFGLATPLGRVSETGVAGLTLGGGYGHLNSPFGLACDNLVEAQVVGADGEVRTASAESHPDLFWALRGGGGNFGVVTSFTFMLHPVGPIVAFAATFYPLEDIADLMRGWRAFTADAPDEVTSFVVSITFPAAPGMPEVIHDRPCAIVAGVHAGNPEEGMAAMQPLRELGTPLFDMSQPMPYTAVQTGFDALFPRAALRAYWKSTYLDALTDDAIDAFGHAALSRPAPLSLVNAYHLGGAVHAVGAEETAFAERSAPFMVSTDGVWSDPAQDAACVSWVRSAIGELGKYGNGGTYLNFGGRSDEPMQAGVDSAFGRNLRRLSEIKAAYDPTNFFQHNNNVVP
ncbi:FAD-binding oxidoreductase [Pseudonocardia saturnea]